MAVDDTNDDDALHAVVDAALSVQAKTVDATAHVPPKEEPKAKDDVALQGTVMAMHDTSDDDLHALVTAALSVRAQDGQDGQDETAQQVPNANS
jgi:hypothetical protein